MGGGGDLKLAIKDSGLKNKEEEQAPGAPNDAMYLKQAEHLIRRAQYKPALTYLMESLHMNPESLVSFQF